MSLLGDYKLARALGKCKGRIKELVAMKREKTIGSKTVWGGVFLALVPLAGVILPQLGLAQHVAAAQQILTALAALFGVTGLAHKLDRMKAK